MEGQVPKCLMKDVRISNHGNWRHIHWNALMSAYGESPFFEYYADDIRPFFEKEWTFLYDFNAEICAKMCELIDIEPHVEPTAGYMFSDEAEGMGIDDYRDAIRPKHSMPDPMFAPKRYYQVYEQRHGFQPNLSMLEVSPEIDFGRNFEQHTRPAVQHGHRERALSVDITAQ